MILLRKCSVGLLDIRLSRLPGNLEELVEVGSAGACHTFHEEHETADGYPYNSENQPSLGVKQVSVLDFLSGLLLFFRPQRQLKSRLVTRVQICHSNG